MMQVRRIATLLPIQSLLAAAALAAALPAGAQEWSWDVYGTDSYNGAVTLTDDTGASFTVTTDPTGAPSPSAAVSSQPPVVLVQQSISSSAGMDWEVFYSSGTFTPPSGVTRVKVTAVGAGGGGGVWNNGANIGGGGSGLVTTGLCDVSGPISVTIGSGGTLISSSSWGWIIGGNGGTSSFGSCVSAAGGNGSNGETGASAGWGWAAGRSANGSHNGAAFALPGVHGVCGGMRGDYFNGGSTFVEDRRGAGGGYGGSGGQGRAGGGGGYFCHQALNPISIPHVVVGTGYGAGGGVDGITAYPGQPGVVIVEW